MKSSFDQHICAMMKAVPRLVGGSGSVVVSKGFDLH